MIAIIAGAIGAVLGLCCLLLACFLIWRRRKRKKDEAQKAPEMGEFLGLVQAAVADPSSEQAQKLAILRAAAERIVRKGASTKHLVDEVKVVIAERNEISMALSEAIEAEMARQRLSAVPTDAEKLDVLRGMFLDPVKPPLPVTMQSTLATSGLAAGWGGGGGIRLPPPKLVPMQTSHLPAQVLDEAYNTYEKIHGRAPPNEAEALRALRDAILPFAKVGGTDPMAALPREAAAAVAFLGGDANDLNDPFEAQMRIGALKDSLDSHIDLLAAEAAYEPPAELAGFGAAIGFSPPGEGGGAGVRVRPPKLTTSVVLSKREEELEESVDLSYTAPDVVGEAPLSHCAPGQTSLGGFGGVRVKPPHLTPNREYTAAEKELETHVDWSYSASQDGGAEGASDILGTGDIDGAAAAAGKSADEIMDEIGGGVRLRPPKLDAISLAPSSLPSEVLDHARELHERRVGAAEKATDAELLQTLRDSLEAPSEPPSRSGSYRRLAPQLHLMMAAEAFANQEDDQADVEEGIDVPTASFAASSNEDRLIMISALVEELDSTIAKEEEKKLVEEDNVLGTRMMRPGFKGGGGARVVPPKLAAPTMLQPPPPPRELEQALRDAYKSISGEKSTANLDVEDVAERVLAHYEAQQALQIVAEDMEAEPVAFEELGADLFVTQDSVDFNSASHEVVDRSARYSCATSDTGRPGTAGLRRSMALAEKMEAIDEKPQSPKRAGRVKSSPRVFIRSASMRSRNSDRGYEEENLSREGSAGVLKAARELSHDGSSNLLASLIGPELAANQASYVRVNEVARKGSSETNLQKALQRATAKVRLLQRLRGAGAAGRMPKVKVAPAPETPQSSPRKQPESPTRSGAITPPPKPAPQLPIPVGVASPSPAVDRNEARERARAKAMERINALEEAKAKYRASIAAGKGSADPPSREAPKAPSREAPKLSLSDSQRQLARAEIQAVDKTKARANLRAKLAQRNEAQAARRAQAQAAAYNDGVNAVQRSIV